MAFWETRGVSRAWLQDIREIARKPRWTLSITPLTILIVCATLLVLFFRVYRLGEVPPEMISDHAEKLLDVSDVLRGEYHVFFPRNTGREAFQMYLTAFVAQVFRTGLTFISLKIGTVLLGLFTLPFVYLLGKEYGNSRVALLAFVFAGIAYWPNVTSRIALRFTLYAAFVAPTLYFLVRGLRTRNRNDFIFAGLAMGIGLHGYSPFRVVPILVIVAFSLAFFHDRLRNQRSNLILGFLALVVISLIVFLPLGRYAVDNPEMFSYRMTSRLGSSERPLPGPAWQIFLKNFWNASTMFFWSNGETWVHSVTLRPALDVVSAVFYGFGVILLLVRYVQQRDWRDIFLLLTIPMLLLPSIMSLAFPNENPALNRTTGAWVPAMVILALAFEGLLTGLEKGLSGRRKAMISAGLGLFLFAWAAQQNYDLVFRQYYRQYQLASWNTSEVGGVVRSFTESFGEPETAWVVGFPHWVDSRLVSINAGFPMMDNAIWPDQFESSLEFQGAKLFLIKPEHTEAIDQLRELYPAGELRRYHAQVETKDFFIYLVPSGGS
jgi:4-amino-4-deoxy-L-arabinose transferase-like glycosyltransferase